MNDHEARVERVLKALRDAEPTDGLEQRVLRTVRARTAAQRAPGRDRVRLALARWPQGYAIAATLLVLVLGSASWWHRGQPAPIHADTGSVAPAEPASVPDISPPTAGMQRIRRPRARGPERRVRLAQAKQPSLDLASGNHPAPEEPLTDEERLLLRLAHHAAPEELEELNPDARDAQASLDKAEFRKFFGPPPTGDSE